MLFTCHERGLQKSDTALMKQSLSTFQKILILHNALVRTLMQSVGFS